MNWKRGFKRATLVSSLLIFVYFLLWGLIKWRVGDCIEWHPEFNYCTKKVHSIDYLRAGSIFGLVSFVGVWVVYGITRWGIIPIVRWVVKGFCGTNGHIWMQMSYKEILQAEQKKEKILNMPDRPAGSKEAKLKELAKELSLSTISRRGDFNADETELVDNINNALQTARVINSAAINSIIAVIAAIAAWAAVLVTVLITVFNK